MLKWPFRKNASRGGSSAAAKGPPSTQGWFPIQDISNGFIHRRDGQLVAAVKVTPVNIFLLTETERVRKIKLLEEVLNGIDYRYQIVSIARPVDLDTYINRLGEMKNEETNRIKIRLLTGYMKHAAAMATSGEALIREFYMLLVQPQSNLKKPKLDEQILYRRAQELATNLSSSDLLSYVCSDEELRDLEFVFFNSSHAAHERAPLTNFSLPATYRPQEV